MLHILLTVLKIIGIILLVIIGLILLIAACLLFVPFRYGAFVKCDESNRYQPEAKVSVTYLLRIVSVSLIYREKNLKKEIRLFGFLLNGFGKKKKKDGDDLASGDDFEDVSSRKKSGLLKKLKRKKGSVKKKKQKKQEEKLSEEDVFLEVYHAEEHQAGGISDEQEIEVVSDSDWEKASVESGPDESAETKQEKKTFILFRILEKIWSIPQKIKFKFFDICDKIKGIREKIKKVRGKAGDLKSFINDENTKVSVSVLKKELIKTLKYISPRKIKGYLYFGFEDPSMTGKVLGVVYAVIRGGMKQFHIYPDFDRKRLETDLAITGRIRLYFFVLLVIRLYRNRDVRTFYDRTKELR